MAEVVLSQQTYFFKGVCVISTWMLEGSTMWAWSALVGEVHLTDEKEYINVHCAYSNAKQAVEKHIGKKLGARV